MEEIIHKLEKQFIGIGEVKGYEFIQMGENNEGYIYKVKGETVDHYEVFKKKTSPICIDFEARIYSEANTKEMYPKANSFGIWAWTYKSRERAINKLKELEND
jgi:hypothetical protein